MNALLKITELKRTCGAFSALLLLCALLLLRQTGPPEQCQELEGLGRHWTSKGTTHTPGWGLGGCHVIGKPLPIPAFANP